MRRVFEVRLIAGNIYCHPDTSIKDMQLTEITSFASRWRLRLSDCLHIFLHIFNKTFLFFKSNTSFQICIEFPLSWCNQLFDYVKFWYHYDTKHIYFRKSFTHISSEKYFLTEIFKLIKLRFFFSSNHVGSIRKRIERRVRKWCWKLFTVKFIYIQVIVS